MTKAEILNQVEDACKRAEVNGKDKDLLVALRAIYLILKSEVARNEKQKKE